MKRFFCLAAVQFAVLGSVCVAFADDATTKAAPVKPAVVKAKPPLHRHPTLIGMLRRNNDVRRRLGLRPHRLNPALTRAAQDHANYMARTAVFDHYANGGPQYRASKYGFRGGVLENIAMGSRSVNSTFAMWEGSSGHYASIVSGTSDAGFGYAISPSGHCYWVGVYANPTKADVAGETEEQIAKALEAEKKALADAKALAAAEAAQAGAAEAEASEVVPASATEPVKEATSVEKPASEPAAAE